MTPWKEATEWERSWWGNCANTFNEEAKQYVYAKYMGLGEFATNWYGRRGWDFRDLSVLDIGGGPSSLLLKSRAVRRIVVDPCEYPDWVHQRYTECGISYFRQRAEDFLPAIPTDLVLIYNCLQHVDSPEQIFEQIRKLHAKELRMFEWIDTGTSDGHLHNLTAERLDGWTGGQGCVRIINEPPCVGKAYFGIFPL